MTQTSITDTKSGHKCEHQTITITITMLVMESQSIVTCHNCRTSGHVKDAVTLSLFQMVKSLTQELTVTVSKDDVETDINQEPRKDNFW